MSALRFNVGAAVLCNMGPDGWQLGRVVALNYREAHWPADQTAPYQVLLEADHALVYVPEDDAGYCREAKAEEMKMLRRIDALAPLPLERVTPGDDGALGTRGALSCAGVADPDGAGYRAGRCQGCDPCPERWRSVELYSEHYRCAARNDLPITHQSVDLGVVRVGEQVAVPANSAPSSGFMQCPTLVRLPPGVRFADDGALAGVVRFDPHRGASYPVTFVAVSTTAWRDASVGLVRLEIAFQVIGNEPPVDFDVEGFRQAQRDARAAAQRSLDVLSEAWRAWGRGALSNRDTCSQMGAELRRLRALLERHPRLDDGWWWVQLGGFHMNVHKLLENTLFECELYLGHALTFGDARVRHQAERNLEGCYQKRLLEAARFMWNVGLTQLMQGDRLAAIETFQRAAAKKDGWGWAVNYGDIWLSEAAARLLQAVTLAPAARPPWVAEATRLLSRAATRAAESGVFGSEGHPWAAELTQALADYQQLKTDEGGLAAWRQALEARTVYWCAQVLGGAPPFPPRPRARLEDAATLVDRLPRYNT